MMLKNICIKLCLLLTPVSFLISSCDDGPKQTCCNYFSESSAYHSAIADPENAPRELIYIYAGTVQKFAKLKDQTNIEYPSAGEYLCAIMPEMNGINYDYHTNDDKDAANVCSESIPMHARMANKIKEAWDNCCYFMGSHVIERQENACSKLDSNADPEASSNCWNELERKSFEYLSCFRTYITQGTCEYIIN